MDYVGYKHSLGTTFIPIVTGEPISSGIATAAATLAASWNDWFPSAHSNWFYWDSYFRDKNWAALIAMTAKMYTDGGLNNIDFQSAPSDQLMEYKNLVKKRILLLPIIYGYTKDPFILQLMQEAVSKGILSASVLPVMNATSSVLNYTQQSTSILPSTGIVSTATQTSKANWILYGGIALGLFLILKKK